MVGALSVTALMAFSLVGSVFAVHDAGIVELDGNIVDNADSAGPPIVSGTDWAAFQSSTGEVATCTRRSLT